MQKPIKIAALVPYKIFPAKMGGQKAIALFYTWLGSLLPVTIISVKNNMTAGSEQFDVLPLLSNSVSRYINPFLFFTLKKTLKQNNFTHLILEHPYFGWLGYLLKKALGIKLIVRSHNIEALRFKSMGKWWWAILWRYEKAIHRQADMSFFITEEDKAYAIKNFGLQQNNCAVITYGIDEKVMPSAEIRSSAKQKLRELYSIQKDKRILLFNGTLDYKPNTDALEVILKEINPLLLKETDFKYKIIICGRGLPQSYNSLVSYKEQNIIYAGFVDDISVYLLGADIFINPVIGGGGIKTKLVEALGAGLCCVSTISGAVGVPVELTGKKLLLAGDGNWEGFAKNIISTDLNAATPGEFFEHFYWGSIAEKAREYLYH